MRRLRLALVALGLVMGAGTGGYVWLEGWSPLDALYMTVITLATVGYGEVRPLTPEGRWFTILLIGSGITCGAFAAGAFTQFVVEEGLGDILEHRRMQHELSHLADHHVVCGWGRMGRGIGAEFRRKQQRFVVIDPDEGRCRELAQDGISYVQGDASEDAVLLAAGIRRARSLVAVAGTDAQNVFITLSARALCPHLFILARSAADENIHKLEIAGASRVVSPYVIGARRIAASVLQPNVVDFLDEEFAVEQIEWELQEVPVRASARLAGCTLEGSRIRDDAGCTILAIRKAGAARFQTNPGPDTLLDPGDLLIALGTPEQLARLCTLAGVRQTCMK